MSTWAARLLSSFLAFQSLPVSFASQVVRHEVSSDRPGHSGVHVIFFAGLEGTGQHLLEQLWSDLHEKHETKLKQLDFPRDHWPCGSAWDAAGIKEMEKTFEQIKTSPGIYTLPQQDSYPCGQGDHATRKTAHPNLKYIETAAKKVGVALHVVFIHRDLGDALRSDCKTRQFESCDLEAEQLIHNGKLLLHDLGSLKQGMVSCFKYGNIASMKRSFKKAFPVKGSRKIVREDFDEGEDSKTDPEVQHLIPHLRSLQTSMDNKCDAYRHRHASSKSDAVPHGPLHDLLRMSSKQAVTLSSNGDGAYRHTCSAGPRSGHCHMAA